MGKKNSPALVPIQSGLSEKLLAPDEARLLRLYRSGTDYAQQVIMINAEAWTADPVHRRVKISNLTIVGGRHD